VKRNRAPESATRNLRLAELLLEESGRLQPGEPEVSEELARLALLIATASHAPEAAARVEGVKALGYCLLGNARRLQEDLAEAEEAFRDAAFHLVQPPDSCERAFYCRMLALLRREQGRMEEAVALLWRAAGIYRGAGETAEEGACLAELGSLLLEEEEHDRAVPPLTRASEALDEERQAGLLARVRRGLALCHKATKDDSSGSHGGPGWLKGEDQ
jgi:tetratricopeptide (TPR) repeat protein